MAYPSVSLVTHFLYAYWADPTSQYSYFVRDNSDFSAYELGKIDRSTNTVITTNTAAYSAFPNIATFMGGLSDTNNLILGEYNGTSPSFTNTIHYLSRSTLAVSSSVTLGSSESTQIAQGSNFSAITGDGRYWAATSFDAGASKSWIRVYDKTNAKYGLIDFTTLSADKEITAINFDSVPNLWVGTVNSASAGHLYRCTITEGSGITLSIANTYSPFSGNNGADFLTYRPTANQFILWAADNAGTNPNGLIINQSNGSTASTFTWPAGNPPSGSGILTMDKACWTNQRYFIENAAADGSYHTPYKLLDLNNSAAETDYATSLWGFQIATRDPFWNGNVAGQANAIFDPVFSTSADVFDQQFVLLQFPAVAGTTRTYVDVFSNRT